jgi:hypothetical protein
LLAQPQVVPAQLSTPPKPSTTEFGMKASAQPVAWKCRDRKSLPTKSSMGVEMTPRDDMDVRRAKSEQLGCILLILYTIILLAIAKTIFWLAIGVL